MPAAMAVTAVRSATSLSVAFAGSAWAEAAISGRKGRGEAAGSCDEASEVAEAFPSDMRDAPELAAMGASTVESVASFSTAASAPSAVNSGRTLAAKASSPAGARNDFSGAGVLETSAFWTPCCATGGEISAGLAAAEGAAVGGKETAELARACPAEARDAPVPAVLVPTAFWPAGLLSVLFFHSACAAIAIFGCKDRDETAGSPAGASGKFSGFWVLEALRAALAPATGVTAGWPACTSVSVAVLTLGTSASAWAGRATSLTAGASTAGAACCCRSLSFGDGRFSAPQNNGWTRSGRTGPLSSGAITGVARVGLSSFSARCLALFALRWDAVEIWEPAGKVPG